MHLEQTGEKSVTRRCFIQKATLVGLGAAIATVPIPSWSGERVVRSLSFYHTHTRQTLDVAYAKGDVYNSNALAVIDQYLADFRTGEVHPIDIRLLDLLWNLQGRLGKMGVFEVISGYRSPRTNSQLRQNTSGVAKRSLHMQGKAIDVRMTGMDTAKVRECAAGMQCGGVGYYAKSDFVHLDTGRVRTW